MRQTIYILVGILAAVSFLWDNFELRSVKAQAIVTRTNCPRFTTAGTIVAVQQVQTQANYPIIVLACYTLDSADFSVDTGTSPPTISVIGGGGGGGGNFIYNETPTGTLNGSNVVFQTVHSPTGLSLFRNGLKMSPSTDYTLSGRTITFVSGQIPQSGDILNSSYQY